MKALDLKRNPLNIQKCLLPECEFLKENYGRYCIVLQKFIVKVGLCEVKNVEESLFLDLSVSTFSAFEKAKRTCSLDGVTFGDFLVLRKPHVAKTVKATVVFVDFLDIKKHSNPLGLEVIVRDILKLFVFCGGTLVNLYNLAESQRFGINSIIIEEVNDGSKNNEVFSVDSNTVINLGKSISQLKFEQFQERENLVEVGGCSRIYDILKETLDFSKNFNNTCLKFVNKLMLIGPPGCGKTILMHNVARDCKSILLQISASDINTLTPVDMEKKLRNVFEEAKVYAEHKEGCVILIEDIDLMSSGRTLHAKRFVGNLITLLEDLDNFPGLVVVATTNSPHEVDSQLRRPRRLEDELEIMVPTEEERMEILEKILRYYKMGFDTKLLHQVSHWTPGFIGADLRQLVVEALMICKKKGRALPQDDSLPLDCFREALTKVIPSALRGAVGLTASDITFSEIGGLEEVKNILDLSVKQQLENPEKFRKFGIPLTKGILLYGPPGCAKTILVRALAKECGATFLATSAADLYSPFVGDAEKKIVLLFAQARIGSPSILFIDEIDAVVGSKSGDRERGVQERILSTLLIEMDGVGLKVNTQKDNSLNILGDGEKDSRKEINSSVIVIGATNRPQLLDDALKRPGRFDRLLYVPPPDASERFKILKKLTEKMSLHESVDLSRLAELTDFYSGADLKNLCQEAGFRALNSTAMVVESIRQSDFEQCLSEYKPSLSEKVTVFYESFQKYNV